MYNILICDDDNRHNEELQAAITDLLGRDSVHVIPCTSAEEPMRLVSQGVQPHALLMDIELRERSGIDTVKRLHRTHPDVPVIYVTGHIGYCSRVYETDHVGFLVKPVQRDDLDAALRRALDRAEQTRTEGIVVRSHQQTQFVPFTKLHFLESSGRKVQFACGGERLESYVRLKDVLTQLDGRFYQCHKSFVVNLDWVSKIEHSDFLLHSGERVPISARHRQEARDRFFHTLGDKLPL